MNSWEFWIDRGGTFTDVVARKPDGSFITYKLLSQNPKQYDDAAIYGIDHVLEHASDQKHKQIHAIKMGTTLATNALLEKKGVPTALLITQGFADALRIGYQNRPDLFALQIKLPDLLYSEVCEVSERFSADGEELKAIDEDEITAMLKNIFARGIRAIAVVFLHAYLFPEHEKKVARIAKEIGFTQISVSHQVSPTIKLIMRGNTTVIDAYLTPLLRRYLQRLASIFTKTRLFFMQSHGGLIEGHLFQGKNSILSGPAAGMIAAVKTSTAAGFKKIISFDMGGTSTDVAHFNGQYERVFESQIAGHRIQTPMLEIHTIAAGGGSVVYFSQGRFQVGPESAGAHPGPACYGKGGPLTITDCQVILGRIQPRFLPNIFGPEGNQALNDKIVSKKFERLLTEIKPITPVIRNVQMMAEGFLNIAMVNMANAIKKISVGRGYDVMQYVLCCFGSAAGQHACAICDILGISKIFIHPMASVFSAFGMGLAEIRIIKERPLHKNLTTGIFNQLRRHFKKLQILAHQELKRQKIHFKEVYLEFFLNMKYEGSNISLPIRVQEYHRIKSNFERQYKQTFGFLPYDKEIVIDSLFVELIAVDSTIKLPKIRFPKSSHHPKPHNMTRMYSDNQWHQVPVFFKKDLNPGDVVTGPSLIIETYNTIVVEKNWLVRVAQQGYLLVESSKKSKSNQKITTKRNSVHLEIFNNLFMSIAEQMGSVLANTAYSINIRERLDYSCAVFDAKGDLIANAQHIPVHLGSMSESVQVIIQQNKQIKSGDVFVLNDPYHGGTHLPDVTVITPVFIPGHKKPQFYVASRGHHADIGGITPGSMPPLSKNIHEEGILLTNFKLITRKKFREQALLTLLTRASWPARNPKQNIADLQAQIAANQKGVLELQKLTKNYTLKVVKFYMRYMHDNAKECVENILSSLKPGRFKYDMDNGNQIAVAISVNRRKKAVTIDFTGTSERQLNNFNAPKAVCRAAILYVFRTLIAENIPLNEYVMKPIKIIIPANCLLNPDYPLAVVAGNVETSQCIVDSLYGALQVMAAAQGTMNNFTFGNETYQYYETLCGGSGAGPGFDGTDAVHTHMTNSRLTDPEVLESQYPIMIECFEIKKRSGGKGKWHGGNGVIRKIRFLQPMQAAILSNRRHVPPYGMAGGKPGKPGKNWIMRANGKIEVLQSTQVVELGMNDLFVIETPGGGGYGSEST